MSITHAPFFALVAAWLAAMIATAAAQDIRTEDLSPGEPNTLVTVEDTLIGDEIVDYTVRADRSQNISVVLLASNASTYFNVLPAGSDAALFIGSTEGNVADLPALAAGSYRIRVYLMRSAARRNETSEYLLGVSIGRPDFANSLFGGPDYWMVASVGGGDALNLRAQSGSVRTALRCRMFSPSWTSIAYARIWRLAGPIRSSGQMPNELQSAMERCPCLLPKGQSK